MAVALEMWLAVSLAGSQRRGLQPVRLKTFLLAADTCLVDLTAPPTSLQWVAPRRHPTSPSQPPSTSCSRRRSTESHTASSSCAARWSLGSDGGLSAGRCWSRSSGGSGQKSVVQNLAPKYALRALIWTCCCERGKSAAGSDSCETAPSKLGATRSGFLVKSRRHHCSCESEPGASLLRSENIRTSIALYFGPLLCHTRPAELTPTSRPRGGDDHQRRVVLRQDEGPL